MKKSFSFIIIIITMLLIPFELSSFASTKYDAFLDDPIGRKMIAMNDTTLEPHKIMAEYLNLLVNQDDLIRIAKSGALDGEKSKFLTENPVKYLKIFHVAILNTLNKANWKYTDDQYDFFVGIIKDSNSRAAKYIPEKEKQLWRTYMPYILWEKYKEAGFLESEINKHLDALYAQSQKQKGAESISTAQPTSVPAKTIKKIKVIGNRDSKRYHLPGMKFYNAIKADHRVEFNSEEDAIKAGYEKAPR